MLYKKIHRQYLREFRDGRKFKDKYDAVYEVLGKLHIDRILIRVWVEKTIKFTKYHDFLLLITPSGRFWLGVDIEWLD